MYLCVIGSSWEQLEGYTLNGKAAHLFSEKGWQRQGTCWGQGVCPGPGGWWWHPSVPPPPPHAAWTFCAAALPGTSPWMSISVRLTHCPRRICWASDTHSGHLSQGRESVQEQNLTGAASHGKSALGLQDESVSCPVSRRLEEVGGGDM